MRAHHCLYCGSAMERVTEAAATCPSCGRINLKEDLRIFRTRRPVPVTVERILKGIVGSLLIGMTALMLLTHRKHGGGIAIGFPIPAAVIAWDTLGLITRRRSVFRVEVLWPAMLGTLLVGPLLVFVTLLVGVQEYGAAWALLPWMLGWAAVVGGGWALVHGARRRRRRPPHADPLRTSFGAEETFQWQHSFRAGDVLGAPMKDGE